MDFVPLSEDLHNKLMSKYSPDGFTISNDTLPEIIKNLKELGT